MNPSGCEQKTGASHWLPAFFAMVAIAWGVFDYPARIRDSIAWLFSPCL